MKNYKLPKKQLSLFGMVLFVYFIGAFYSTSFNIKTWGEGVLRLCCFGFVIVGILYLMFNDETD